MLKNKLLSIYLSNDNSGKCKQNLKDIFTSIKKNMPIEIKGKLKIKDIEIAFKESTNKINIELLVNALETIDLLSESKDKKTIIFIDEIQMLVKLSGDDYQEFSKQFRAVVNKLRYTTIIIAGSELRIIDQMMTKESSKFLVRLNNLPLKGISESDFCAHLAEACKSRKIYLEDNVGELCVKLSGGIASTLAYYGTRIIDSRNNMTRITAKIGHTWTLKTETLGHLSRSHLDTRAGVYLDTF